MSAVQLLGMAQTLGIIAVLTVLVQLLWFRRRQSHVLKSRIRQRLEQRSELASEALPGRVAAGPLERFLLRAVSSWGAVSWAGWQYWCFLFW